MADPTGDDAAADVGETHGSERTTAPMSEYATRDVAIGFVVLVVGVAVAFGLPLVLV